MKPYCGEKEKLPKNTFRGSGPTCFKVGKGVGLVMAKNMIERGQLAGYTVAPTENMGVMVDMAAGPRHTRQSLSQMKKDELVGVARREYNIPLRDARKMGKDELVGAIVALF